MAFQWSLLDKPFSLAKATISVPWLMALETFGDDTHVKIEVKGTWKVGGGVLPVCGPDGHGGLGFAASQLVLEDCPFGAALGKLGGSSASHHIPTAEGADAGKPALSADEPFPIGAYCVTKIPEGVIGPLFIGFNTMVRPIDVIDLIVTISGARP